MNTSFVGQFITALAKLNQIGPNSRIKWPVIAPRSDRLAIGEIVLVSDLDNPRGRYFVNTQFGLCEIPKGIAALQGMG